MKTPIFYNPICYYKMLHYTMLVCFLFLVHTLENYCLYIYLSLLMPKINLKVFLKNNKKNF